MTTKLDKQQEENAYAGPKPGMLYLQPMILTRSPHNIAKHKHDFPFPYRAGTGQLTDLTLACLRINSRMLIQSFLPT